MLSGSELVNYDNLWRESVVDAGPDLAQLYSFA
jgi:hypothetical protein